MLGGDILSRVVRKRVSEEVTVEPRLGAGERMNHVTIWGQRKALRRGYAGTGSSLTEKRDYCGR